MNFEIASFVLGVLVGSTLAVSIAVPRAGRVLTRLLSVVMFIVGVGLLSWAIVSITGLGEFRPIHWNQFAITETVEALGLGGGLFAGALVALWLSFSQRLE